MTRSAFTLKQVHLQALLAVLSACGASTLVTLLLRGAPELAVSNPGTFWLVLISVLAVAGVMLPLAGTVRRLAPLHARRTPLFFLIPALIQAVFLDPRFSAFPVQLFCILGVVIGLLGSIITLFDALETRQTTTPARSRLTE